MLFAVFSELVFLGIITVLPGMQQTFSPSLSSSCTYFLFLLSQSPSGSLIKEFYSSQKSGCPGCLFLPYYLSCVYMNKDNEKYAIQRTSHLLNVLQSCASFRQLHAYLEYM